MKKSALILALALSAALVSSCRFFAVSDSANIKFNVGEKVEASDVIETRTFPVAPFDAVDVGMACRMEYVPGDCGVQIRTHDNLFEHLEVSVDDGTLCIRQDGSSFSGMDTMEIFIKSPSLAGAVLSGAADFDAAEGIRSEGEFKLRASGACDVDIRKLEAPSAELKLSGACSLKLAGVDSGELRLRISGAGDAEVSGKTESADISISGAGKVDLRKLDVAELNTNVSGAGNVIRPRK